MVQLKYWQLKTVITGSYNAMCQLIYAVTCINVCVLAVFICRPAIMTRINSVARKSIIKLCIGVRPMGWC